MRLETESFLFFGKDLESLEFCRTATKHLEEITQDYGLLANNRNEGSKIIVALGEGRYPYEIVEKVLGEIDLRFYWEKDLDLHLFCRGLTTCWLKRWAWANQKDSSSMEGGLLLYAISWSLEKRLNPHLLLEKSSHWRKGSWRTEAEIWQNNGVLSNAEESRQWAYLCYQYWHYCEDAKPVLISKLLQGDKRLNLSISQGGKIPWKVYFANQLARGKSYIYSIADSEAWLEEKRYFEKEDKRIPLEMIWLYRDEDLIRFTVKDRILALKLVLRRINPVYYNSVLSLGICLEAFLEKDRPNFAKTLGTFLFDAQIAKEQQVEIEKISLGL